MTETPTYIMPFRRRRQEKTNYVKRLAFLKSNKPRLVVRRSNQYVTVQLIGYNRDGDEVLVSTSSKDLAKFGWKPGKNLPSAYLTGYACGLKAKKKNIPNAVLDIGLITPVHGSRVFSALKGAVDAGLSIPASESVFPKDERLKGTHISGEVANLFEKTKKSIESEVGGSK